MINKDKTARMTFYTPLSVRDKIYEYCDAHGTSVTSFCNLAIAEFLTNETLRVDQMAQMLEFVKTPNFQKMIDILEKQNDDFDQVRLDDLKNSL